MIGIVILNYNTWDESINCCESILRNTTVPNRIYIVDNCSPVKPSESQMSMIKRIGVELIMHNVNSGYAAGNNVGLRKAYSDGCDFFLICNSDVIFDDNSIDKMTIFLTKTNNAGIVGPQIYDLRGNRKPIYMLSKLTALGKIKNMLLGTPIRFLFQGFEKKFIMYDIPKKPIKVFGVSGCCFLVSKECYEKVFPFDENTFLYEEEYIIGCKLEKVGIDAYVIPNARIIHAEGISTGGMSRFSYRCLIESEQYYLRTYLNSGLLVRIMLLFLRKLLWLFRYSDNNNLH